MSDDIGKTLLAHTWKVLSGPAGKAAAAATSAAAIGVVVRWVHNKNAEAPEVSLEDVRKIVSTELVELNVTTIVVIESTEDPEDREDDGTLPDTFLRRIACYFPGSWPHEQYQKAVDGIVRGLEKATGRTVEERRRQHSDPLPKPPPKWE